VRTLTSAECAELKRQQAEQAKKDKAQRQAAQEEAARIAADLIFPKRPQRKRRLFQALIKGDQLNDSLRRG
jgi:hypothetical protein